MTYDDDLRGRLWLNLLGLALSLALVPRLPGPGLLLSASNGLLALEKVRILRRRRRQP